MNFNFNISKLIPPWRKENVGEKVKIPNPDEAATKIQATWRGKKSRRTLRLQAISTLIVQRYVRGFFQRQAYKKELSSHRIKRQMEKEQSSRIRQIKTKETDLHLLNTIKADQYLKFEELRKNHYAKSIQRGWRQYCNRQEDAETQGNGPAYVYGKQSQYTHTANKYAKLRTQSNQYRKKKAHQLASSRDELRKEGEEKNGPQDEQTTAKKKAKQKKMQSLQTYIQEIYQTQVNQNRLHAFQPKPIPELEENALGLSQLYQRIREDTITRKKQAQQDPNNPIPPTMQPSDSGGIRHKYQELIHLQEKMQVLLGEYVDNRDFLDQDKFHRQKQIQTCQQLMVDLLHLPAMDENIIATINNNTAANNGDDSSQAKKEGERTALERWLYDGIFLEDILATTATTTNAMDHKEVFQKALQEHYSTMEMLTDQHRWDAVFLPAGMPTSFQADPIHPNAALSSNKEEKKGESTKLKQNDDEGMIGMQKNYALKSLKSLLTTDDDNMVTSYGMMTNQDDSLYWLEYAHHPSRLLSTLQPLPKHLELGLPLPNYNKQLYDIPNAETLATVQPIKRKTSQQTKVYQEMYNMLLCNPNQRLESLQLAIQQEQQQINNLSYVLQEDLYDTLYHQVTANYASYLEAQEKERKAKELYYLTKAQSMVRGFIARRKYQEILRQQRIYSAFQHLIFEINHPRQLPGQGAGQVMKKQRTMGRYPFQNWSAAAHGVEEESTPIKATAKATDPHIMSSQDVFLIAKGLQELTSTPQPSSSSSRPAQQQQYTIPKALHPGTPGAQRNSSSSRPGSSSGNSNVRLNHVQPPVNNQYTPSSAAGSGGGTSTPYQNNPLRDSVTESLLSALTPLPINKVDNTPLSGMITPQVHQIHQQQAQLQQGIVLPSSTFSVNNTPRMTDYRYDNDGMATPILQLPTARHPSSSNKLPPSLGSDQNMNTARSYLSTERSTTEGGGSHSSMITITTPNKANPTSQQQQHHRYNNLPTANTTVPSTPVPLLPIKPSPNHPMYYNTSHVAHTPVIPSPTKELLEEDEPDEDDNDHKHASSLVHDTSSIMLSPFMELPDSQRKKGNRTQGNNVNDEDDLVDTGMFTEGGYISSPSHGYSLTRSLSGSFGQVVFQPPRTDIVKTLLDEDDEDDENMNAPLPTTGRKSGGRANTNKPMVKPYKASQPANSQSLQDHAHLLFIEIDTRYQKGQCESAKIVESALITDIRHFQKPLAYGLLTTLIKQHGPFVIIDWLKHYHFPLPPSATPSPYNTPSQSKHRVAASPATPSSSPQSQEELPVEQITILLSEVYLGSNRHANARNVNSETISLIIQLSFLFRLMGAIHSTGNVRLIDLQAIFEDLWFHSLSQDYQLAIRTLQKVRCLVVKKATRDRMSTYNYVMNVIDKHDLPVRELSQIQPEAIMRLLLILYQPISQERHAKSPYVFPEYIREKLTHVTYFVMEYIKLEKEFHTIPNKLDQVIKVLGGSLPSYRQLQTKLQTWFRAVPQSYSQLLNELPTLLLPSSTATPSKKSDFLVTMQLFLQYLHQESVLPLTTSEARLFGDILTRGQARLDAEYSDEEEEASDQHDIQVRDIDVKLIYRLKNNELIEVAID